MVLIRYEGPKGGPGMQEMLYPTSYIKSKGLGKVCALDYRWTVFRGHVGFEHRPCVARSGAGGSIGLVEEGDSIEIDIPNRSIQLAVSDATGGRRVAMETMRHAWQPIKRDRVVSVALACLCGADYECRHWRGARCQPGGTAQPHRCAATIMKTY